MKLVGQPGRTNFFVIAPDDLGLSLFLQKILEGVAATGDVHFVPAESLSKEAARDLEKEARYAPRGSSALTHFYIWGSQKLPTDSVGPLLKAVEEAKYARFIFQSSRPCRKLFTLMSRCQMVRLPFLSKKVVLGNLRAMSQDAKTADQLGLYDGTLQGTMRALQMKDTLMSIRRDLARGFRGLSAAMTQDVAGSLALMPALAPSLTREEWAYLNRNDGLDRRRVLLFLVMCREGKID